MTWLMYEHADEERWAQTARAITAEFGKKVVEDEAEAEALEAGPSGGEGAGRSGGRRMTGMGAPERARRSANGAGRAGWTGTEAGATSSRTAASMTWRVASVPRPS